MDSLAAGQTANNDVHRKLVNASLKMQIAFGAGPFLFRPGIGLGGGWVFVAEPKEYSGIEVIGDED